nr:unnamed protein product [Callosobruchus analis]
MARRREAELGLSFHVTTSATRGRYLQLLVYILQSYIRCGNPSNLQKSKTIPKY